MLIECPNCEDRVDIDDVNTQKQERGLELLVKCPSCEKWFIIQRIAEVRQKLQAAKCAYMVTEQGEEVRIRIS